MNDRGGTAANPLDASASGSEGRPENPAGTPKALHSDCGAQSKWGASREEWLDFSDTLGLTRDLLPVVSNPSAVRSPVSTLKGLGKTPSRYNAHRQVVGFSRWTEYIAKAADVERSARQGGCG